MEVKVIKKAAGSKAAEGRKENLGEENKRPNRAFDPGLAPYENAGYVLWSGFDFLSGISSKDRFETVCSVLRNAESGNLETVTFQNGTDGDGVTYENEVIESSLDESTLHTLCHMKIIDRAYYLFNIKGRPLMIIVEKSRCDVCVFYDIRLFSREAVLNLKSTIEEEYYSQTRKKFGIVRS